MFLRKPTCVLGLLQQFQSVADRQSLDESSLQRRLLVSLYGMEQMPASSESVTVAMGLATKNC